MKKTFLVFLLSVFVLSLSAQEKKVKTGWNFGGALPAITYDSDLGFEYGALAEFFNYGDGRSILILLIIPILKYHGTPKEVGFTGLCSNHVTLYREFIG